MYAFQDKRIGKKIHKKEFKFFMVLKRDFSQYFFLKNWGFQYFLKIYESFWVNIQIRDYHVCGFVLDNIEVT